MPRFADGKLQPIETDTVQIEQRGPNAANTMSAVKTSPFL